MKEQNSTQQQLRLLAASNACLRRNLIRFSHQIKQDGLLAYHDELTGLPNRNLLLDRLHQAMQQAARQHKQVLLMFIGLNKFKWLNDTLGHVAGDSLLQQVAMRLAINIRGADTACRYGEDKFVIMMPDIEERHSVDAAVRKIRAQLAEPYVIDKQVISLTASVGTALYRGDEQSCADLIQQADNDMHHAKANSSTPTISLM
jgi:diguanylate cyclase (GGDEF)-like protein